MSTPSTTRKRRSGIARMLSAPAPMPQPSNLPIEPAIIELSRNSGAVRTLTAGATRLTAKTMSRAGSTSSWQEDSWDMFDLVGEQRFLATTLANRMGQALLYVGKRSEDPLGDPVPVESGTPYDVFEEFGGGAEGRTQILTRAGLNLFIAGDCTLMGIPEAMEAAVLEEVPEPEETKKSKNELRAVPEALLAEGDEIDLADLRWHLLSVSEVSSRGGGDITVKFSETQHLETNLSKVYGIRIWRPHPRRHWEADSPTRASLPVLREIVGLTMRIGSEIDSRLAGAGLLLIPQAASDAVKAQAGLQADGEDSDPFVENLIESMVTSLTTRGTAADVVPITAVVPGDSIDQFRHIAFSTPLDAEAKNLRDEAIRRLALGQDAPPEILLGVGGMNHWGAWLVREDVVTTHIEPPLALICEALTTKFLRPVLIQQGMSPEEAADYVIWYDVSQLIQRPNRASDAFALHSRGVISDEALREATGFTDEDAPTIEKPEENSDPVSQLVLQMVGTNPTLAASPGLLELAKQIDWMVTGEWRKKVEEQEKQAAEMAELAAMGAKAAAEQNANPNTDTQDEGPPKTDGANDMPETPKDA